MLIHSPTQRSVRLLRRLIETGGLAIEIARLRVELRRQLAEVEASRARIVDAGNVERRRIERDLHDGAQQRLVSIGLTLRHAQHAAPGTAPQHAVATIDDAGTPSSTAAIEELRELAHGLPPSQLDAGLAPAFRELARRDTRCRSSVSVSGERFAAGVEAAAYFIGCEGVTNAVKHAHATRIELSAGRDERPARRLASPMTASAVPRPTRGTGLAGLTDRVAALGGTLRIDSDDQARHDT